MTTFEIFFKFLKNLLKNFQITIINNDEFFEILNMSLREIIWKNIMKPYLRNMENMENMGNIRNMGNIGNIGKYIHI